MSSPWCLRCEVRDRSGSTGGSGSRRNLRAGSVASVSKSIPVFVFSLVRFRRKWIRAAGAKGNFTRPVVFHGSRPEFHGSRPYFTVPGLSFTSGLGAMCTFALQSLQRHVQHLHTSFLWGDQTSSVFQTLQGGIAQIVCICRIGVDMVCKSLVQKTMTRSPRPIDHVRPIKGAHNCTSGVPNALLVSITFRGNGTT